VGVSSRRAYRVGLQWVCQVEEPIEWVYSGCVKYMQWVCQEHIECVCQVEEHIQWVCEVEELIEWVCQVEEPIEWVS